MGIKKAQTPSHTLYQACDSPKSAMVESALWCAAPMLIWILLIKSRSRSQFGREIEQQKDSCSKNTDAKLQQFCEISLYFRQFNVFFDHVVAFWHKIPNQQGLVNWYNSLAWIKVSVSLLLPFRLYVNHFVSVSSIKGNSRKNLISLLFAVSSGTPKLRS